VACGFVMNASYPPRSTTIWIHAGLPVRKDPPIHQRTPRATHGEVAVTVLPDLAGRRRDQGSADVGPRAPGTLRKRHHGVLGRRMAVGEHRNLELGSDATRVGRR
jgi:hypothetical protein